ncbi:MAG: hypothetical protein MZV64_64015 [Ignavibacteriales bacterium]|nr:hypothetical protein [Ignavibacteriales bacterium]
MRSSRCSSPGPLSANRSRPPRWRARSWTARAPRCPASRSKRRARRWSARRPP